MVESERDKNGGEIKEYNLNASKSDGARRQLQGCLVRIMLPDVIGIISEAVAKVKKHTFNIEEDGIGCSFTGTDNTKLIFQLSAYRRRKAFLL